MRKTRRSLGALVIVALLAVAGYLCAPTVLQWRALPDAPEVPTLGEDDCFDIAIHIDPLGNIEIDGDLEVVGAADESAGLPVALRGR